MTSSSAVGCDGLNPVLGALGGHNPLPSEELEYLRTKGFISHIGSGGNGDVWRCRAQEFGNITVVCRVT